MQPDYEDLEDDESGFNWMLVIVLLLAVAGFISLAWYAYQTGSAPSQSGEVVVITADQSPVKRRPADPGGREFRHQDKTVYEAMRGPADVEQGEVVIRPDPEEPVAMPNTQAQGRSQSADRKVAEIIQNAVKDMQQQEAEKEKARQAAAKKIITPPEKARAPVKEKPAPVAQDTRKTANKEQSVAAVATGERIQLGAYRSNVEAERQWRKIRAANKDLLGGKPHQVIRADLGGRGVFYRLRVAGFDSQESAQAMCRSLSARKQACFVVR